MAGECMIGRVGSRPRGAADRQRYCGMTNIRNVVCLDEKTDPAFNVAPGFEFAALHCRCEGGRETRIAF